MRTYKHFLFSIFSFLLIANGSHAQNVQWGHAIHSGTAKTIMTKVAPNGNVLVGGYFSGTSDLDPSAGTYNITSNGSEDMFLACYTSNGAFLWGFNVGGTQIDAILDLSFDAQSNVAVVGYFRGTNVDFDPSAGGSALLTDNGTTSGSIPWGGDGFVAKYSSTGLYQWAFKIGGPWAYDMTECVEMDAAGNVYVGGTYLDDVDLDPSASLHMINGAINGRCYLAKYSPAGQLVWGYGFLSQGTGGTDCSVRAMELRGNEIYICGFVENFTDFDPSTNVASWTTNSSGDVYIAKYDLNGNYILHSVVSGNSFEEASEITLDQSNNIYITGYASAGTLTFGTNVVTAPGGAGNSDIFIAKYNSNGVYQWAKMYGSNQADAGCALTYCDNHIYCTGYFNGTVDFDASSMVNSLQSAGDKDIYTVKYDLNGNYVCGFRTGSGGPDEGLCINPDAQSNLYEGGSFNQTVDFDPSTLTYNMSASGMYSGYITKYIYTNTTSGYVVTGDTICDGEQAYITITDTVNGSSFNVTINDGTTNYTFTNIQSGVPFPMVPAPTSTTTYTWMIGGGQSVCTSSSSSGSFTISVSPGATANAGPDVTVCDNIYVQLNGSGSTYYNWSPSSVLNNSNLPNPTLTVTDTSLTFMLVATNSYGCKDTDYVNVSVHQAIAMANAGPDTSVCLGGPLQLQGSGNGSYTWYPSTGLNNPNIASPVFTGGNNSLFNLVVTDQYGCTDTDQVAITMLPQLAADAGPDQLVCAGDSVTLQANGGTNYSWYPAAGMTGSNTADPTVYVIQTTTYSVIVSGSAGCTDTDVVTISVIPVPDFDVVPEVHVCKGDSVMLIASGGSNYVWTPDETISTISNDTVIVWPSVSTTYYVSITESQCGYTDSEMVQVDVHVANVNIIKATPIGCGQKFGLLEATGAVQYSWTPAGSLSDPNISNPASLTTVPTLYTVTGTDQYGCVGTDTARIEVIYDNMTGLFVPSVFTPNNDGKNDCYRILLPPGITDYELHIYNRFGNNVFNADDASDCWDGTYNGEPCDLGTYYYYYKMKSPACGVNSEGKGDITLLK